MICFHIHTYYICFSVVLRVVGAFPYQMIRKVSCTESMVLAGGVQDAEEGAGKLTSVPLTIGSHVVPLETKDMVCLFVWHGLLPTFGTMLTSVLMLAQ